MSPEVSLHITQTDVSSAWTDTYGTYLGKGRDREGERQRPYSDWNTNTPPGTPSPSETRTEQRQFRNPDRKSHPRCKPKSQPSPGTQERCSSTKGAGSHSFKLSLPHPAPYMQGRDGSLCRCASADSSCISETPSLCRAFSLEMQEGAPPACGGPAPHRRG